MKDFVRAALIVASLGYAVLRCAPNSKGGDTPHGMNDATADPEAIRAMFRRPGDLGLLPPLGVLVLDFDPPSEKARPTATPEERVAETWERLEGVYERVPATRDAPVLVSRSGAPHLVTRMPPGTPASSCGTFYGPDGEPWGDIRGSTRTYVLVALLVVDGRQYGVVRPVVGPENLPAVTLDQLGQRIDAPTPSGAGGLGPVGVVVAGDAREVANPETYGRPLLQGAHDRLAARASGRHDATLNEACVLGRGVAGYQRAGLPGLSEEEACDALEAASTTNGYTAKVGQRDVWRTIRDGLNYGMARPFEVTTRAAAPLPKAAVRSSRRRRNREHLWGVVLVSRYQRLRAAIERTVAPENLDKAQRFIFPRLVREDFTAAEVDALLKLMRDRTGVGMRSLRKALSDVAKADPEREASGYGVIDGAVHYVKDTQNGPQPVPLANFAATISREVVRDDGLEQVRHFVVTGPLADGRPLPIAEVSADQMASGHSSGRATGLSVPRGGRVDVSALVAEIGFQDWISRHWEPPNRDGFTRCPNERAHRHGHDSEPWRNCVVYPDHLYCFACNAHYSLVDLVIELGHAGDFLSAVRYLEGYAGRPAPTRAAKVRSRPRKEGPGDVAGRCTREPVSDALAARYWARVAKQLGERLPPPLQGRGFEIDDRATLGLTHGHKTATARDGFFPTLDPSGQIVTVRRRFAEPGDGPRYKPAPGFNGEQNPAWCSPAVECGDLLVVEGELNGMAVWLALDGLVSVMGMNATTGSAWYETFSGRDVYVYGDDGGPGQAAKHRWARTAYLAGARSVYVLDPWPEGDACTVAGTLGRAELRARVG